MEYPDPSTYKHVLHFIRRTRRYRKSGADSPVVKSLRRHLRGTKGDEPSTASLQVTCRSSLTLEKRYVLFPRASPYLVYETIAYVAFPRKRLKSGIFEGASKLMEHDIQQPDPQNSRATGNEPDSYAQKPRAQQITLPAHARELIGLLEGAGNEAWCVGGFVRDSLLERPCYDVDIATNATWTTVKELCDNAGLPTHETGVKHGTITVVFPDHDMAAIEVTTYRVDGSYQDARHPDNVTFVQTIEEDLARRDFTINALAYHPSRGIVDPYGGLEDMNNKLIRVVGDPAKRFSEDALRILRACRFASQLGFDVEESTYHAMTRQKSLLGKVSSERITDELDRLLLGEYVHDAIMSTVDVLAFVIPELVAMRGCEQKTPFHIYDVLEHTAYTIQNAPADRLVRWTALCHDMGKPAAAFFDEEGVEHFRGHAVVSQALTCELMDRLNMGTTFKDKVLLLVKHHDDLIEPKPRNVKRMLMRFDGDVDLFRALCDIKRADARSQAPRCAPRIELADQLEEVLDEVIARHEVFSLKDLAITGDDLIKAGIPQGPRIGRLLTSALEAVIAEEVPNENAALIAYVCSTASAEADGGSAEADEVGDAPTTASAPEDAESEEDA